MDGALGRGNVMKYSPGVLTGNWFEDMQLKEDQRKLLNSQKALAAESLKKAAVNPAAMEALLLRLSANTQLSNNLGVVEMGTPLVIINKKTNATLAVDVSPLSAPGPEKVSLSGSYAAAPQVRSTWVLQRCADENNIFFNLHAREPNILHYGQRVRICNENASDRGFLYVHSELTFGQYSSACQPTVAAFGASADNVFVVDRPKTRRDNVEEGDPVRVGDEVVFTHSITNQPLCCDGTLKKTSYGMECNVHCGYVPLNFSRSRAAVATNDENIFYFSTGAEFSGPTINRRSSATMASTMPMTSGEGVELLMERIRNGALHFGGRVAFRAISRALHVACNEHRLVYYDRNQMHAFISRLGVTLLPIELDIIMKCFDKTGNGKVCAQEFLAELRGNMSNDRLAAVVRAYQQLVIEGEGCVEFKNMFNLFRENAHALPDVMDGVTLREEAIFDFERSWPSVLGPKVDTVRLEEFVEYYNDVSPATPDDARFIAMVRNSWAIPETDEYLKGEPYRVVEVTKVNGTTETMKLPDTLVLDIQNEESVKRLLVQHGVQDVKAFKVSRRM